MNLKVEWANNPTTFAEIEDWNAVTLKHLNPKKRAELQKVIFDFMAEYILLTVTSETVIPDTLIKDMEYMLVQQLIPNTSDYILLLIQSNKFGTRVIRIADYVVKL